jgi:polyisoprenoid-binding protein YceI
MNDMNFRKFMLQSVVIVGLVFSTNWNADTANAKIGFSIKGPFGTVNGSFTGLKATIIFDEKDLAGSSFKASIDAKTVTTGVGMRNHHLRNEEQWLNTDKFPEITFQSKKIEKQAAGFLARGDLTLKGVAKPIDIAFTFAPSGNAGVFKGQFTIKREDYNLGKPGGSVGDVVTINLEVPVKK